jgi:hypothetical protein
MFFRRAPFCAMVAAGKVEYAHYSLKLDGAVLEGTYHEDGEDGPTSQARVRVTFDDFAGKVGEFQLAKMPAPQDPNEAPPTPQPLPEPKTVFDFDFRAQSDLRFHLSEGRCALPVAAVTLGPNARPNPHTVKDTGISRVEDVPPACVPAIGMDCPRIRRPSVTHAS